MGVEDSVVVSFCRREVVKKVREASLGALVIKKGYRKGVRVPWRVGHRGGILSSTLLAQNRRCSSKTF